MSQPRPLFITFILWTIGAVSIVHGQEQGKLLHDAPLIDLDRLSSGVVHLQQDAADAGVFEILERSFDNSKDLIRYLRQNKEKLGEGLLVSYAWKTVGEGPFFEGLVKLCVDLDLNLYRWTPTGEPDLDDQAEWVVASSDSTPGTS